MTKKPFVLAALAGTGLAFAAVPAQAESENAATILETGACTGFVPTEDGKVPDASQFFTTFHKEHRLSTKGGGESTMCVFEVPEHLIPERPRQAVNFACRAYDVIGYESKMIVTPGGRAFLICRSR